MQINTGDAVNNTRATVQKKKCIRTTVAVLRPQVSGFAERQERESWGNTFFRTVNKAR
jgi:hypothetical protein